MFRVPSSGRPNPAPTEVGGRPVAGAPPTRPAPPPAAAPGFRPVAPAERPSGAAASPGTSLAAARARPRAHALDPSLDRLDRASLAERTELPGLVKALELGAERVTLVGFAERAATVLFGAQSKPSLRYRELRDGFAAKGQLAAFDAILDRLPRPALNRLLADGAAPVDVLQVFAKGRAAGLESPAPASPAEILRLFARAGEVVTREALEACLAPDDRARFAAGAMSPRAVSRAVERARRHDVDVLVLGAGVSGMAAAGELLDRNFAVTVLEGRDRVGGRTHTDHETFSVPFDEGAAWLHSVEKNDLAPIARARGFTLVPDDRPSLAYDGRTPPEVAGARLEREIERVSEAWSSLGEAGVDVPASTVTPAGGRLTKIAASVLGPLDLGVDVDRVSTKDYATIAASAGDAFVKEGLGTFTRSFSHGLPIELSTHVETIRWGRDGIEATTKDGRTYRAKMILLTASVGVLKSGKIAFDPPLPATKLAALEDVPMGTFDKVAMEFASDVTGGVPPATRVRELSQPDQPIEFLVRPFGANLIVAFVGGSASEALEAKGPESALEYALARLERIYGDRVRTELRATKVTAWGNDPFAEGSYTAAKPGKQHQRAALRAPVEDRLFFAGEATHDSWAEHVTGAYLTGVDAAEEMAKKLVADSAKEAERG